MNAPVSFTERAGAPVRTEPLIRFEQVGKVFAGRTGAAAVAALQNINLSVRRGSIMGVIGRSGAGKSTLIRLVNGLEKPSSGRVLVDDVDVATLEGPALRQTQRSIGMIFQHFNLLSSRTAFDNVAFPLEIAGATRAEIAARVDPLLELVGLTDKRDRYPAELSGGQKQRVGIARALATQPKALLSDEATSALDPETTRQILDLLGTVNRELGVTILLITHEMSVIRAVANEVAVLEGGSVVEHGDVYDIFTQPTHEVTRSFLAAEAGRQIPSWIKAKLSATPIAGGQTIIRITFRGPLANDAILSQLSRELQIDVNILSGTIDTIAGKPFGWVVAGLPGEPDLAAHSLDFLTQRGLGVEVLGHVA
jgi:D-methionine transport system ATP-binding protein